MSQTFPGDKPFPTETPLFPQQTQNKHTHTTHTQTVCIVRVCACGFIQLHKWQPVT